MAASRGVASDAWPSISAFREAGGLSFQDVGVAQARANYELSCAANGVPSEPLHSVRDTCIDTQTGVSVRVYEPTARGDGEARAGVLFIHGGGWVIGNLDTHDRLCRYLAAHSAAVVVAVDYRLAPEHVYPAAINDVRAGLRWLAENAARLGIDPARLAIVGDSAGAQMAAVLANESAAGLMPPVRSQVLLYPVTDLRMNTPSYARVTSGFPLTDQTMRWFVDLYAPDERVRTAPDASPILAQLPARGPVALVYTVEHDPLCDEGIRYAAALAEAGTSVEHRHLVGYAHGLFTSAGRIGRGMQELARVADFVGETTRGLTEHEMHITL